MTRYYEFSNNASVWFTDGSTYRSKANEAVGLGVSGSKFRFMGHTPRIFQSEIHTINLYAQKFF